ncbi:zinc-dependent metalloprotease [Gordonia sp. Z-3]|jgi:putative hydrolase|uniref:zinc-dependent metalloprotease n=1 Tax=unclassified Gordonia (in: high G+C Gram-positive bacteria) TaxID=2657482 RepID=UPI002E2BC3F0|nr:zinc-dependent metalloprotease [Gordonia sp. Z-3]MED5799724.1 zinc-dependent metalloprotease [Gordonia sp. Z-3]
MSDLPFGFSPSGDGDDERRAENERRKDQSGSGESSGGTQNPFGFALGGEGFDPSSFDPAQLGQMFSQLGSMFSGMGAGITPGSGGGGPVNYQVASNLARQQIGNFTPVLDKETNAVTDAVRLAEVWLDDVTTFPSGVRQSVAWTPVTWLEESMPTWKRLCDPVAEQLSRTWEQNLPAEAAQFAGPMMGMLTQMSGMAFGTQLGQGLGQLAKEVLTSTDVGLPLAPEGVAVLLPEAIAKFAEGLEQPAQEIVVFLAAREAAHVRLFSHVPWLRQRLLSTVEEYARGISIDFSGIADMTSGVDPQELLSNPAKLEELIGSSASFEPTTTPEQQAALARLETLLALIEGWVEQVVSTALADRIPSVGALTETMRRRRASGGPAEQTFATLVGLELRPRKVREASALWRQLLEAGDIATRDGVWAHPDLMPDAEDLDNPAAFIDGVIGGGVSSFDDPIAQLEATLAQERAEKSADGADGREPSDDSGAGDNPAGNDTDHEDGGRDGNSA